MDGKDGLDYVVVDEMEMFEDNSDSSDSSLSSPPLNQKAQIRKWLRPTNYLAGSSEYKKCLRSYLPGTCNWLQTTEAYENWHGLPAHNTLWIRAPSGAGKSVFAAMITAKLSKSEEVPVLHFFFHQNAEAHDQPQSLVRDFVSQMLDYSSSLQDRLKEYMDSGRLVDSLSLAELWDDLLRAMSSHPKLYCIIDALDEMDTEQHWFLNALIELGRLKTSSIKVLMTTKPLPPIADELVRASMPPLVLEPHIVDEDIAIYVRHRLSSRPDFNSEQRQAVETAICNRSRGSFLYARLILDELASHFILVPDTQSLQRYLDWLPTTLDDTYNRMLANHAISSGMPQDLQPIVLQWVTHASRPMRLLELCDMLEFVNEIGIRKDTKAALRETCGPLLVILNDNTLSVVHHSLAEFLIDSKRENAKAGSNNDQPQYPIINSQATHRLLAMTCLKYLRSGCLSQWKLEDDRTKAQLNLKIRYPFLRYAITGWYFHVSKLISIDEELCSVLDSLLAPKCSSYTSLLNWTWLGCNLKKTSALHIAAWAGMSSYAQHLIRKGLDCNMLDAQNRTPLSWAAEKGDSEIIALLLETASNTNLADNFGLAPIHYAARAGNHAVVKLLLAAGVDPLTSTKEAVAPRSQRAHKTVGQTPLQYVCESGNVKTLQEMIPYLKTEDLSNAVCVAAYYGRIQIVDALLSVPGVSVDTPLCSDTPLFLAASQLHLDLICLLLKKGADPNKQSTDHRYAKVTYPRPPIEPSYPPLHAICRSKETFYRDETPEDILTNCFQALFQSGCDINAKDSSGRTALHHSVCQQSNKSNNSNLISILLLENGADAMARDSVGNTPLHRVPLKLDSALIVQKLISKGADINARRQFDGQSPLFNAMNNRNSIAWKVLYPHVLDWNVQDPNGNTPLHIALRRSFDPTPIIRALLDAGADPKLQNFHGETPLHVAGEIVGRSKEVVPLLLKAGADINARDNNGLTPLQTINMESESDRAVSNISLLLKYGADIHCQDNYGHGVLHIECAKAYGANNVVLQCLLDAGADPLLRSHIGNTLLHEVSQLYSRVKSTDSLKQTVQILLNQGISPTAKNNKGETPLHFVSGSVPRYQFLEANPLDMLLDSEIGADINVIDKNGINPIHLAATISEEVFVKLLRRGADLFALTHENRSLLHTAARARQSNILGLILEHYTSIGRLDELLDLPDCTGRTALHDACISGRPESVSLLLSAGANPNFKDKDDFTPLHVCSGFEKENILWRFGREGDTAKRPPVTGAIHAAGVLLTEKSRQQAQYAVAYRNFDTADKWRRIVVNDDTVRLRDIIRNLLAHGACITAVTNEKLHHRSIIEFAVYSGCEEMVSELLPLLRELPPQFKPGDVSRGYRTRPEEFDFTGTYLTLRHNSLLELMKREVERGKHAAARLCQRLLTVREFTALEGLASTGLDLTPQIDPSYTDFLTTLAFWGYAPLLAVLGDTVKDPSWVNGSGIAEKDDGCISPFLMTAAGSALPNLDTFKVLVEKFGADVNKRLVQQIRRPSGMIHLPGRSVLHILSEGARWWHIEAIKYILDHGADPNIKNEVTGQTPLHVAVTCSGLYQKRVTAMLLDHGADPNAVDNHGFTCIGEATRNPELSPLFTRHQTSKATEGGHLLLSAIDDQAFPTIAALVETETQPNLLAVDEEGNNALHLLKSTPHNDNEYQAIFLALIKKAPSLVSQKNKKGYTPYHYAAQRLQLWTVDTLLAAGADPLEPDPDGNTSLHHFSPSIYTSGLDDPCCIMFKKHLTMGISIDSQNKLGETPAFVFFKSAISGSGRIHRESFAPFLEADANLFLQNKQRETLLHIVAKTNYGANMDAAKGDREEVIDSFNFLLQKGLDPMVRDANKMTALDVASANNHSEILDLFDMDSPVVICPV